MKLSEIDYSVYTEDSAYVQAAVDQAAALDGSLVIPAVNPRTKNRLYSFTSAVKLPNGISIILDGCHIVHAEGTIDNLFKSCFARTEEGRKPENKQYDIRILGQNGAVLDGGVHNGLTEATHKDYGYSACFVNSAIHLQNVERFEIAGFTVTEPRYWCITLHHCSSGSIHDIRFDCSGKMPNMDGIDLRRGCHDIFIHDISGYTGDDVIALTNLSGGDIPCSVFGEKDDIYNVIIRDVLASTSDERGIVRLLCNNGTRIHDVVIDTVIDISEKAGYPRAGSAVRLNELGYHNPNLPEPKYGELNNITIRNILTRARIGVEMSCHAAHVLIDNLQMREDGATALFFRDGDIRHIRANNISYTDDTEHLDIDDNVTEAAVNKRKPSELPLEQRKVCAVYFQNSHVQDLKINGLQSCSHLTSVFGGANAYPVSAADVVRLDESVPLCEGDIKLQM